MQSVPMLCAGEGGCFLRGLLETPVATTGASLPVFAVRPVVVSPGGKEGDAERVDLRSKQSAEQQVAGER